MFKWLGIIVRMLRSALRPQRELAIEKLVLRQQLAVLKHRHQRPRLTEPNAFDSLMAIFTETPICSFTNSDSACRVTPSPRAARVTERPRGSRCTTSSIAEPRSAACGPPASSERMNRTLLDECFRINGPNHLVHLIRR